MLERIKAWQRSSSHKALLLTGARQTGKTFIVREFARDRYESFIEVNFIENKDAASFLGSAADSRDLVTRITFLTGQEIKPGSTCIFFDEVQKEPEVVTMSKFLLEDGRFDVILSGSLLGVELKGIRSFPVGYVHIERMYPLDFEEFCWSQAVPDEMLDTLRACYQGRQPIEKTLHERFVRLFRRYVVLGGMPEAVQRYNDTSHDLNEVRAVTSDIIEQYREDIVQYARGRAPQIKMIFDNIPSELAKVNKRFHMKSIKKGATYDRYNDDFAWLIDAGVALPTYAVEEPRFPLIRTKVKERFKLYSSDVGLLISQYPRKITMDVIEGSSSVNFGSVYENVIAQELQAIYPHLYYYNSNRKGEIDFLFETDSGTVIPIEVKSGKDYKLHTALNNLLETDEYGIEFAYVLSEGNLSIGERKGKPVYYLPLYLTFCLSFEKSLDLTDDPRGQVPRVI